MTKLLISISIVKIIVLIIHQPSWVTAEPLRGNMKPANIPFVASIAIKLPDSLYIDRAHFCSGSLIGKNLVLTAAHCLDDQTYEQVDVVIGAADLRGAKPKYGVHSWITFENWAATKDPRMIKLPVNDIAIIKLNSSVSGVTPANITTQRSSDLYGKNASFIGWAAGNIDTSRFLRKAKVRILTITECQQRFQLLTNTLTDIPEGYLCTAANPFALTTKGDSGGPLIDGENNILGVNYGICPEEVPNCSESFADKRRFNLHMGLTDEYRQFINEMKNSSL